MKACKQLSEITATMKKFCEDGNFGSVAHPAPLHQHIVGSSSSKAFMQTNSSKSTLHQIVEAVKSEDVKAIGLYGDVGMGKTMLAKQVAEEAGKHFDRVVMVTISQNQQVRDIQGVIADFLNLTLEQESVEGRASKLKLRLKTGEKILLILDGVWKEFSLEAVGVSSSDGGCKVLLTTHSRSYVPDGLLTQRNFQLAILPEDEAWDLFQGVAGIGDEVRSHDGTKNAIAECKGRPKTLVTLGRVLRGKCPSEWDESLLQLHASKHKVTEDLKEQAKKLCLRRECVKTEIKMAKDNAEEINEDVENWLIDVEKIMEDMEVFMNEFNKNRYFYDEHGDTTKVEELTVIVKKLCTESNFGTISHASPLHQVMGSSVSADFMPSQSAESAFSQILEALQKDDVNIIGLYGMGGIGKTTLAVQVQKEVERVKSFDHTIMVTVSQRPEVRSIQGTIADFLNLEFKQETKEGRASKLNKRLKDEKILIILDDLWKQLDLTTIGISLNECKGCKILLTTRRRSVCDSMDCQTSIQLDLLSEDEACKFFRKKACLSEQLKLNILAEQIVKECKGLPIALATVGAALRNKGEDEWSEALENLRNSRLMDIVGVDDDEINAYKCLRLSYDYLTHSAQGQEGQFILLLCSLYPEYRKIEVEVLTRYAFGMDLFRHVKSIEDTRRKVRVIVRFLKDSCLLLGADDERCVKMHDVVRDAILWIGGTEPRERNALIVRDESDLKEFMKSNSFQNCRAVSFMPSSLLVLPKYDPLICPNLEVILIFAGKHKVELSDNFFEHMNFLKVLDLRRFTWVRYRFGLPQSFHNLTDLRTLMLEGCVCSNSSVVRESRNLEILSLKYCKIDCGEVASGLKKLRLVDLLDSEAEEMFPSNMIGALSKLEELYGFVVGEGSMFPSNMTKDVLPPNLVALSMKINVASRLPMGFCFPNIPTYFISIGERYSSASHAGVCRCLRTWCQDESAVVNSCKKLFTTVQDLFLGHCKDLCSLNAFNSKAEGFLQMLEYLKVSNCKEMEWVLEFEEDSNNTNTILRLQLLKTLELKDLPELKHIWKGATRSVSLQNLIQVKIHGCSKLKCVFPSRSLAISLQQLEILTIENCIDLEEIISRREGSDDDDFSCCCCFTNLKELEVSSCKKLKTIFPIVKSTARARHLHPQSHHCRLPKLQSIVLNGNDQLEHVFGHQTQVECPSLQVLKVKSCPNISATHFVATQLHAPSPKRLKENFTDNIQRVEQQIEDDFPQNTIICFSSLTIVHLSDCNKLKQVFTTSLVTSLCQLESLIVKRCNELEQVIGTVGEGKDEPTIEVCFESLKTLKVSECGKLKTVFPIFIALPKLERLRLKSNAELEHVFGRSTLNCTGKCPSLKDLFVVGCPKMFADMQPIKANYVRLTVGDIKGVEEIMQIERQTDDDVEMLTHLKKLSLQNLEDLKRIWRGPTQNISFVELDRLEVIGCNKLKHLLDIAPCLPKLEKLIVRRCNELEQVIMVEDGEEEHESDGKAELSLKVGFENLQILYVSNCEKLKTIFSVFIHLPKLDCLRLESNAELECIWKG